MSGSIVLAAIVLKLSLYGCCRLILPIIPQASLVFTPFVFMISVITIIYASLSTLRAIDIKELIAYSSVCHAAVYLMGVFSNSVNGIEGSIVLGIAHGFVSSALFICVGGVLYDRAHSRLITYYRGIASIMPLFALLFFVFCLGNSGTPLTLNFVGEFLSLYGAFERLPVIGALACSSIVFSAAYTIFMYNRIVFGGSLSSYFAVNIPDLNKREFVILIALAIPTVLFGVYPTPILDGLHYSVSTLIYATNEVGANAMAFAPCAFITKRFYSKKIKPLSSDETSLNPYFITGFTDAEGSFCLTITKNSNYSFGFTVKCVFKINLNTKDRALLEMIKEHFRVGKIYKHGENSIQYLVSSLKDLEVIIAHFDKYPLITHKQRDFLLFKAAVQIIKNKEHMTTEGLKKFASLRAQSNKGIQIADLFPGEEIIPVSLPEVNPSTIPNPNWLVGFVTGEGCFFVSIANSPTSKIGKSVVLEFGVTQHSRDKKLMLSFINYLQCGRVVS